MVVYFVLATIRAVSQLFACHSGCNPLNKYLNLHITPKYPTPPIPTNNSITFRNLNKPSISLNNLPNNTLFRILINILFPIKINCINCCYKLFCDGCIFVFVGI